MPIIVSVITLLFCIVLSKIKTRLKRYANSQKRQKDVSDKHFPEN